MEETLSDRLTPATLKDCGLENIERSKCQLILVIAEEVFYSISFLAEKNCIQFHSLGTLSNENGDGDGDRGLSGKIQIIICA